MKKTFALAALILAFTICAPAQTSNTFNALQFQTPGVATDVGTLITRAQAACNAAATYPCVIILDPALANFATGTMPTRCAQCVWLDYRSPGALFANPSITGVFTNTQQNDSLTSTVGTINFGTRYSAQQGGNFATEAIAGGVNCSGTVHQCNGVAGYVVATSTTPFPVALYGQAEVGIAGGKAYGFNTVSADTASLSGTVVGGEVDINIANAASSVTGYSLQGAWAAQPTSATAFSFGSLNSSFHWQNGLVFGGNFTNNVCAGGGTCGSIVLNQSGTGAGQDSQQILFNSSTKSSLLRLQESDGFLFHNVGYTAPVFKSTVATGTAPISVVSTTPVPTLVVSNHPQISSCVSLANNGTCPAFTALTGGKEVFGDVALVAGASTVNGLPFTSATSYRCTATDASNANAVKVTVNSASQITFAGTATDVIAFKCGGN